MKDIYNGIESSSFPVTIVSQSDSVIKNFTAHLGIYNQEALAIENFWLDGDRKLMNFYLKDKFYIVDISDKNFHFHANCNNSNYP